MALIAYCCTLMVVSYFKYLGRVLSASDNDWLAVILSFWRAQQKRAQPLRVLGQEGEDARML